MKTIFMKEAEVPREWYIIDAEGKPLGRVAAKVASMVRGKHKTIYAPHQENGDYIVVINADKIAVTGNKASDKIYYHHTGYAGGIRGITFEKLIQKKPWEPLRLAVKGMLPKGPLGRKLIKNVKIYAGADHPHGAQNPKKIEF
ncbi:50S ribosomal protein L13 [Treponema phagedenis]|uniref:Large ribosomal subunit protein uL13 n=1 Tax=Treponema phagedenis TaxID=162 RepID=A0A0B7GQB7_TREPH|nr:50S ribosomal protein L13 [Treponema phagedenis]EFW37285.1 ribosomal protein L13 [Treponema phagedenis F0421]NVP23376.1 50S ribosomal protein L13 [Treponema phagedenis]QEJ95596.1 50S ribosomal protein L13 [Treponema phagedenis]QEJ98518.1 50S ribosomal protein L13 [Treponema phagedenis]QEK01449.1 50S ribosomal protein L13 [Treponema phagedenis]